jgi:hypothetical protein
VPHLARPAFRPRFAAFTRDGSARCGRLGESDADLGRLVTSAVADRG